MDGCIFCQIAAGEIPSRKVHEDENVLAFYDLSPQAPVHVLIVPKVHTENLSQARELSDEVLAQLLRTVANVAGQLGLEETGYRVIVNSGQDAQQSVPHLHLHLLGGASMPAKMV